MSGRWRVWLSEEAEAAMTDAARVAHPRETGGVLVGVLAGTRPWVTQAVHVPSKASTATSYVLPAGARRRAVEKARRLDQRLGYLGDWHSHPADVDPSGCDTATIAAEAADESSGCPRPLLVILRRAADAYWVDARQWTGQSLRSLQVLRAGPLDAGARRLRPRARLRALTRARRHP